MRVFLLGLSLVISLVAFGQQKQPNILWITMEDTSPHFIGCYGNTVAKTPNIDRLAAEGVRFTNVFANSPVCSSARSTIITGVLNGALGTGNHRSTYPLPDFIKGFPAFLKEKGWYTSNNVKTDYATSDAKRLIRESWYESSRNAGWWNRAEGQRFFCVFNHTQSHQSRTMTNPYPWYREFVFNKLNEDLITGENEFEMPPHFRDSPEMRKHFARVYNAVSLADQNIGLLLDSLEQDGLIDETIIFLYADHGEAIPGGKSGSIGIGYKVPFIVWFPEKYKHLSPWGTATVSNELINFDDLAPTMLSLAGIKAPDYMTGRPFMGKYREEPAPFIFTSRNRIDETPGLARTITDGRYMFTRVFMPQFPELRYQKYADVSPLVQQIRKDYGDGKLTDVQSQMLEERVTGEYLFDLKADPWKLHNLAQDKEHQRTVKKFREELFDHILEIRDVMFLPEYSINQLSENTTPFEYRKTDAYNLPAILKVASRTGNEGNIERLFKMLEEKDPVVLYWVLMRLHAMKVDWSASKDKVIALMNHEYPPVQVLASMIAFDQLDSERAEQKLRSFINSDHPLLALQAVQLIQYTQGAASVFQKDLQELIERKKDKKAFLSPVSAAETALFYLNGRKLYYSHMKKWLE